MKKQLQMIKKVCLALLGIMSIQLNSIAQTNIAPLGTPSASTCNTGPCSTLNDLNLGTCGTQQVWISTTTPPSTIPGVEWLQFDFSSPKAINKLVIHHGQTGGRFMSGGLIQRWDGTAWINHHTFTGLNTNNCINDINFPIMMTARFRITAFQLTVGQLSNPNFREIEIYEGSVSNNDVGISSIDSINSICTTNPIPVYATINNFGKNVITTCNINWSINGSLQTPVSFTGALDTAGGANPSAVVLLGNHAFGVNPSVIRAWTAQPNGLADTVRVNDTSTVSKRVAIAAGVYTIGGTNPNYLTINAAVNDLKQRGICGPVVFNIAPGTYNEQVDFDAAIIGADSIKTITFRGLNKNTTIINFASINTNKRHTVLISGGVKFLTFRDLTIIGNANISTDFAWTLQITGTNTSDIKIKNCNIRVDGTFASSSTSTNHIAVLLGGTATGYTSGSSISRLEFDSNYVFNGWAGIIHYSVSFGSVDNKFRNNTIENSYQYGMFFTQYNRVDILNNRINMRQQITSFIPFYMVTCTATGGAINISGNVIPRLGTYGMYFVSVNNPVGNKGLLTNNVIGGEQSNAAGSGIWLSSTSQFMIQHNSVLLNLIGSTATTNSGLYITGGLGNSVVNNSFARTVTGVGYPMYIVSNVSIDSLNYNNYFKSDTTNGLIYVGTARFPSTFVGLGGYDSSSRNNPPSFISDNNLNINSGCNKGILLPQVLTDINGRIRSTNPTMGAYEYNQISNELTLERIILPTPAITTGFSDVAFLVRNTGNNSVTGFEAGYIHNNSTPVTQFWTGSLNSCDTTRVTFSGSQQVLLGNVNQIKMYVSGPNSTYDSIPTNDTLIGSYYTPISGNLTIGGNNANFPTVIAAVNTLKAVGISGPVRFTINPGTYLGQVHLNGTIPGLDAVNTIEFVGSNKDSVIIQTSMGGTPTFMISLLRYITLRNVTIINTSPTGVGFAVVGNTTTNAGTGCNIINCKVLLPNYFNGTAYSIIYTGTVSGYGVSALRADSIRIDSNIVEGGYYAITIYGATNALYNRGIKVRHNICSNINYMGCYIAYNYNAMDITHNTFDMQSALGYYGMYLFSNQNASTTVSHVIANNLVRNYGAYGMYLYFPTTANANNAPTLVYNNMLFSGPTYGFIYGMFVQDNSNSRTWVYHNTVTNRFASPTANYSVFYSTGSTNLVVKNNIFANYAGVISAARFNTNPTAGNVNHNLYFNTANPSLVFTNGISYTALNYKTSLAGGDSSHNQDPNFVSMTDLHTTNGCTPRGMNFTSVISTDFDGNIRSTSPMIGADEIIAPNNDLEIIALVSPAAPVITGNQDLKVLVRNSGGNLISSFDVTYTNNNGTPRTVAYSGLGIAPCGTDTVTFSGANQINVINGTNRIKAYTSNPNFGTDANRANDTINVITGPPMIGTYTIGAAPSNYTTVTAAIDDLKVRGIAGHVTFALKTGIYNTTNQIPSIIGASDLATITFTSLANNRDSVEINWLTLPGGINQVFEISGSFINFKKLTIRQLQPNATGAQYTTIRYTGNIVKDTIEDCVIAGPRFGIDGTNAQSFLVHLNGSTGGATANGLVFRNNYFRGAYNGVYIMGTTTYLIKNIIFDNNLFDSIGYGAINYLQYATGTKITNNTFNHRVMGTATTSFNYIYYNDSGYVMQNNTINVSPGKTNYWYNYYTRNDNNNRALVANNIINAGSGGMFWYFGNSITNNLEIVHNTMNMGSGYFYMAYAGLTNVKVFNNIIRSSQTYAYYLTASPASIALLESDYNLIFTQTSTTPFYAGAARTFLAHKTSSPLYERNSVNYRPAFISNTNLNININDTAVWLINGRGRHLTVALNDFNNVSRPLTPASGVPDLGAIEVTPATGVLPPRATAVPDSVIVGTTQHFMLAGDSIAKIHWDQFSSTPTAIEVRHYTGELPSLQGANGSVARSYVDINMSGTGTYIYGLDMHYKQPWMNTIPNQTSLRSAFNQNGAWTSNTLLLSTPDSVRRIVSTPSLGTPQARHTLTDDNNPALTFLTINTHPQSQSKCNGDSAVFTANATGSNITYQWQVNTGSGFTNINGATSGTLVVNNLNISFNGNVYRCNISSSNGSTTTNTATLVVGVATVVTSQPINRSGCEGENVVFSVTATGTNLLYQWEENSGSGFGPITGATSPSFTKVFINSAMNANQYRCVVTGTCGVVTSNAAILTVNTVINISTQPSPTSITTCAGSNVTFRMAATGVTTFQWQVNTGNNFVDIQGANDDTLVISNVPAAYNGIVRCVLVGACNITVSQTATLTVEQPGVWTGNASTSWTATGNWGCGQLPTITTNVTIPSTAVNMPTISANATIGNLTVANGANLSITGTALLSLNGNLENNGTISNIGNGISFAGTTAQTMQAGSYTGKVTINNANGVSLSSNFTLGDVMTMTNGRVFLGNFNFTMEAAGSITGANTTRYLVTNGSGSMFINNIGTGGRTGAVLFPVGQNATNYNPATLTNTGTADNFNVRVISGAYRDYAGNSPVQATALTSNAVNVTWLINEEVAGGSTASVQLQWSGTQELPSFSRTLCYVSRYDGLAWNPGAAGAAIGSNPYTRTVTGITAFSPFGVGSNNSLPVEMLSFTAKASGAAAILNWSTASEINNSHFVVERSTNNEVFEKVGEVKGNETSFNTNKYEFVDATAKTYGTTVYYRLIQVDMDGSENNSGVVSVNFNKEGNGISVVPNPFTQSFTIHMGDQANHTVTLTDVSGRVLATQTVVNSSSITMSEMEGLSSGVYFITIDSTKRIKVVKQ